MQTLALLSNSTVCLDLLTGLIRLKCHRTPHVDASKIPHCPPSPCISNHAYFQHGQSLLFSAESCAQQLALLWWHFKARSLCPSLQ